MKVKKSRKIITYTLGGLILLCFILFLVLFLLSGGFMKRSYMEPWDKSYATTYSDPRISLSAIGLLAANNHNMQPWKIKLATDNSMEFYLYADSSRATEEVDPLYRQFMISQGSFLEYLKVAGDVLGWKVNITLFPDGEYDESDALHSMDSKPVAKILLSKAKPIQTPLYDAMYLADTNREAYRPDQLEEKEISVLETSANDNYASIKFYTDKDSLDKIGDYAMQSATIEAGVARIMEESSAIFRANEYRKNKYRYGYSVEGQGTTGLMKIMMQGLLTVFPSLNEGKAASQNFIHYTKVSVKSSPAYAMIVTDGNSRTEQVESGMLYSRLVLTGHTLGLVMQPLSQVLEEYPEMKTLYDDFKKAYAPVNGTVQMLFRVGKPTKAAPLSMRRDVRSLLMQQ